MYKPLKEMAMPEYRNVTVIKDGYHGR